MATHQDDYDEENDEFDLIDDDAVFDAFEFGAKQESSLASNWLKNFALALDPDNVEENIWTPLPGPQTKAFYSEADELFYGGAAGGGKQLGLTQNVLTPFGWKKAADVKVGDTLVAHDGTATKVLAIYPHQNVDMYRFTFVDGAQVEVSDDHLWAYWESSTRVKAERCYLLYSPEKGLHKERTRYKLGLSKDLFEYHRKQVKAQEEDKRPYWIIMPLCDPVRFTRPSKTEQGDVIRIDPYLLGLLIGDGAITDSGISITGVDLEIRQYVEGYADGDIHWDEVKHLTTFRGKTKEELRKQLESYGLWNCKSDTKFIPEDYLFASLDVRFDLMAGLIDTGGHIDDRGHISYCTISEKLAKDVQHLARSLGCKASITTETPMYTDKDVEKLKGRLGYNVWIQGGEQIKRFSKLPRKRDNIKPFNGDVSEAGRCVTNIEYIGKGDGVCFAIDHPQGLHVVQDFIVTHNTDLMIGLALSALSPHKKAICFRRSYPEHKDFVSRAQSVLQKANIKDARYKGGNIQRFTNLPGGKSLEIGSVANFAAAQKYKGRPHDLKLFDEVSDISERVYTFLIGWARTTEKGVPVRVVAAGNPPTNTEGQWVIRRWAPWLDPYHVNPAEPGELRWFATLNGEDTEITEELSKDGSKGKPFKFTDKKGETFTVRPKSRTFVPARLSDNPFLAESGEYESVLQNMPEPYRSQLLYGDFGLSFKADPWQVIPSDWVAKAEARWRAAEENGTLSRSDKVNPAFGLDVAEAGSDATLLVKLTGNYMQWFHYIEVLSKDQAKIPILQAQQVAAKLQGLRHSPVGVDAIGVGLGLASQLKHMGYNVVPLKVSRKSSSRDKSGVFQFLNKRAEMWWRLREALDPDKENALALPPDKRLRAELTAVKYERTPNDRLKIEDKDKIRERLGRSPDIAEALMMALYVQSRVSVPLRIV